jgi:hypothetical protein
MTINLLRGRSRGSKLPEGSGPAIGDTDAHVFNCPVCSRPLSNGTAKCPACGTRLIMGLRLRQAGGILALGLAIGLFSGIGITAVLISASIHEPAQAVAAVPSAAPVAVVAPVAPTPVTAVVIPIPGAPSIAISALSGTAVVNGRIAVDTTTLRSTLAAKGSSTADIARALRSLGADAALGSDLTDRLGTWTAAAPVTTQLESFYRTMAKTARDGLRSSLTDNGGYRTAGFAMLKVLAALDGVDAASRTLAQTVDLELPPVAIPGS